MKTLAGVKTLLNLRKVAYVELWFVNQTGTRISENPTQPTVGGMPIPAGVYAMPLCEYPSETMLERARRLEILDRWTPVARFHYTKYDSVTFQGEKALKLHRAFASIIYNKNKNNNNNNKFNKEKGLNKCPHQLVISPLLS